LTVSSQTDFTSYLFAHEWWAENYNNALTHLGIIHSLLHTLDRSLPLDSYIFEGAIYDDVMICLESGTRPLRALDWSPPDLSASEKSQVRAKLEELRMSGLLDESNMWSPDPRLSQRRTLAIFLIPLKPVQGSAPMIVLDPRMGAGLIRAAKMLGNAHMLALLREILFLIEVMQYTWISTVPLPTFAQWATTKVHAILHILLSMHLTGEWECVRLNMIILLGVLSSNRAWRSGAMNASRLRARLTNELKHARAIGLPSQRHAEETILIHFEDQRMLFWVLIVGAASTMQGLDHDWFVKQATRIAGGLGLWTEEQLMVVVVEYLCLLRSQQTVIQEVCSLLQPYKDSSDT
jgi:hypothetical protein